MSNTPNVNPQEKLLKIPVYRVRTIMKSSPEVENIGQESLFMIAKATELFIEHLALMALEGSESSKKVEFADLAEIVQEKQNLEFLHDIIPRKILARDYWNILDKFKAKETDSLDNYI